MVGPFRRFRVADKVVESDVITSFYLEPVDGGPVWQARPGQYLTVKVPTEDGAVLKAYSLSGNVAETGHHRITVKREACPPDAAPAPQGVGSCWLHDVVGPGTEIDVAAPRGRFVLDETSQRPVLLLAGGVGLTPLLSMLHRLAEGDRKVWFLHGCENGAVHAMGDEVEKLAVESGGKIRRHFVYRVPTEVDRDVAQPDSQGMIDKPLLQSLLPLDDYDVYLCGPTPFMVAMFRLVRELGVAGDRIAYEFFGKACALEALAAKSAPAVKAGALALPALANLAFLTNPEAQAAPVCKPTRTGAGAVRDGEVISLLELAEAVGLSPEFSCRAGICNSCRCVITEGEVEYFEEPLDPPAAGEVLICCSRPVGRVVLAL